MKRRRAILPTLGLLALSSAFLVVGAASRGKAVAAPLSAADEAAATQLASDFSLSQGEAESRIARQASLGDLNVQIAQMVPEYAGGYIDQAHAGTLVIRLTAASVVAKQLIANSPVAAYVQVDPTALDTYDELVADSKAVVSYLDESHTAFVTQVSMDIRNNRVVVEGPSASSASEGMHEYLVGLQSRYAGAVVYVGDNAPGGHETGSCAIQNPSEAVACDPPLRGGVWINEGNTYNYSTGYCSGGFIGRATTDGTRLLITAGHCVQGYSGAWGEKQPAFPGYDGNIHTVGSAWSQSILGSAGDMGAVIINNVSGWNPQHWVAVTAGGSGTAHPTATDLQYTIDRVDPGNAADVPVSGSPPGAYLCHTGATSGTECGIVIESGDSVSYIGGTIVGNLGKVNFTVCQGDSGGPVYVNHTAFGIEVAGSDNSISMEVGPTGAYENCYSPGYYTMLSQLSSISASVDTS